MRTSLFNKFTDLSKDFTQDFSLLWELPNETRQLLVSKVSDIYNARTIGETNELMNTVVVEAGGDATKTLRVLKVLLFIIQEWNPIKDKPEVFYQDLLDLGLIPPEGKSIEQELILDFLSKIEGENPKRLKRMFAGYILPYYKGIYSCVDYRAIISNPFSSQQISLSANDYSPQCIGFVPIIILKIQRSSGDPAEFIFQMEEDDVKSLINSLQGSLRELQAAKNLIPETL